MILCHWHKIDHNHNNIMDVINQQNDWSYEHTVQLHYYNHYKDNFHFHKITFTRSLSHTHTQHPHNPQRTSHKKQHPSPLTQPPPPIPTHTTHTAPSHHQHTHTLYISHYKLKQITYRYTTYRYIPHNITTPYHHSIHATLTYTSHTTLPPHTSTPPTLPQPQHTHCHT
jgi:hypothetical protein